jgi:hypothetical protein
MHRLLRSIVMAMAFAVCVAAVSDTARACPMCKTANEQDDAKPRAYMYSILFMLSMPAMMFSGFGIAFYRLSRKSQQQQLAAFEAANGESSANANEGPVDTEQTTTPEFH